MTQSTNSARIACCKCGNVSLELRDTPIMTAACYCDDCQRANKHLEALPDAPAIAEADGGTHFILYRKDRVQCQRGQEYLREYRHSPDSQTRRVFATCCNSAMFLEFTKGHWLSMYTNRLDSADRPPLDVRTMTMYRRPDVEFSDNIPSPKKHTVWFMWKLLSAWVAMGFRTPKIDYVNGEING